MTRETKIGLLIGLGFIVIFAVLLSHTSVPLPVADTRPLAMSETSGDGFGVKPISPRIHGDRSLPLVEKTASKGPADPSRVQVQDLDTASPAQEESAPNGQPNGIGLAKRELLVDASGGGADKAPLVGLPSPKILDGASRWAQDHANWGRRLTGDHSKVATDQTSVAVSDRPVRMAPMPRLVKASKVEEPAAAAKQDQSTATDSAAPDGDADPEKTRKSPRVPRQEPKDYIVRKGDTVVKIVRANYGKASPRKMEFFVKANKAVIKDKNTIIAGQKLSIPQLPPELFEAATGFDVSGVNNSGRVTANREAAHVSLTTAGNRVAPTPVSEPAANRKASGSSIKLRTYEIRPKDTLVSIARRELGSSMYWKEIQKLNPKINPRKMRPGMEIRLPEKPLSALPQESRERA